VNTNGYGLKAVYRLNEASHIQLSARGADDRLASVSALALLTSPAHEVGLDVRLAVQPSPLDNFAESDNPYYLVFGRSLPYWRGRADLWKAVTSDTVTFEAHVGFDARRLLEDSPQPFNRNIGRAYALASVSRIAGLRGLALTLNADRIAASAQLDGSGEWAAGGSLSYAAGRVRAEVGTTYYAYRYDYYQQVSEYADVRVYYADLRARLADWLSLRARYSFEVFDRRLHDVTVGLAEVF
jgi:hypothetical protein